MLAPLDADFEIDFSDCPPPPTTARDIYLAWLACPGDDATDALTRVALTLIEERDAYRDALSASCTRLHDMLPRRES